MLEAFNGLPYETKRLVLIVAAPIALVILRIMTRKSFWVGLKNLVFAAAVLFGKIYGCYLAFVYIIWPGYYEYVSHLPNQPRCGMTDVCEPKAYWGFTLFVIVFVCGLAIVGYRLGSGVGMALNEVTNDPKILSDILKNMRKPK